MRVFIFSYMFLERVYLSYVSLRVFLCVIPYDYICLCVYLSYMCGYMCLYVWFRMFMCVCELIARKRWSGLLHFLHKLSGNFSMCSFVLIIVYINSYSFYSIMIYFFYLISFFVYLSYYWYLIGSNFPVFIILLRVGL